MTLLWILSAVFGGGSAGLLGVYLIGLNMPFLGIGMAHAAMAGAIFAAVFGLPPLPVALATALAAAAVMAWLSTTRARADLGTITSIFLSFTMGMAFLGIGLNRGDMTPVLSLLWGSLLFVRPVDVALMGILFALLLGFTALFRRPMDALLFSRTVSRLSGLRERPLLVLFMILAALIITLNLQIVGGLMMYSLLTNPAASAYEAAPSMSAIRRWALALGVVGTLGGFGLSWLLDMPSGACIVLVSTAIYLVAVLAARHARHQ
jgi:manganese/iron transport system permease protein